MEIDSARNHYVKQIENDLSAFVKEHKVAEIALQVKKQRVSPPQLCTSIADLLESGKIIREYTQVYESKTQRIPVHYMVRDFYSFFRLVEVKNKLYLTVVRIFGLALPRCLIFGLLLIPFYSDQRFR
jgi:hypothetical protein